MEFVEFKDSGRKAKNKLYHVGKYSFSKIEIRHLLIAFVMILLTIMVHQMGIATVVEMFPSSAFWIIFGFYFVTIGLGFVLHEMGHKLVAQYYGFVSEFRADFGMLFLMFGIAIFSPMILLAPGAVMIYGRPTIKQNGIISIAGPLVNLCLAFVFIILSLLFPGGLLSTLFNMGIMVNAFLGIFNMLPFWVLDGKKVLNWSLKYYLMVMVPLVLIFVGNMFGYI